MSDARPQISYAEASQVLKSYNLGALQFLRPGAGTANPAVIAVTTKGQFFVKRRNPRYDSKEQLSYDHGVVQHLARAGLPVTPSLRTNSGSRWVTGERGVHEVYPLVQGKPHMPGRSEQIRAAGSTLAALHLATQDLEPPGDKTLPRLHDPRDVLTGLRWAHQQNVEEDADRIACLVECAETVARRLPDRAYWRLPLCIIHGDYHPANLKFEGDAVAGVFDFDWVGRGPRMVDLADGLLFFCGVRKRPLDPGDIVSLTQAFELDREMMAAFGQGYGSLIEPTGQELAALPELMRARWLFCRVDAMQRKIPQEQKLAYLLEEIELPLQQIESHEEWLESGVWLRP